MGKQEYDIANHLPSSLPNINSLLKNDVMKFAIAVLFLIAIPVILLAVLLFVISLAVQRFFTPKSSEDTVVYPYLTSWEEAA